MSEIDRNVFIRSYWNYYLELEDQFMRTKRFVEFDKFNSNTYSIEYLELLQAVCSEIDVVAKILAEVCDPAFKTVKNKNIQKWGYYLQLAYPHIEEISVSFHSDYSIRPWNNWKYERYTNKKGALSYRLLQKPKKETPSWWNAYNKVKHERTSHFEDGKPNYIQANQKNLVYAFAALFVLESLFLDSVKGEAEKIYTPSKLFFLENIKEKVSC